MALIGKLLLLCPAAIAVFYTYRLGRAFGGRWGGLAAGLFLAMIIALIDRPSVFSGMAPEAFAYPLLAASLYYLARQAFSPLAACALLSALLSPQAYVAALAMAAVWLSTWGGLGWRKTLAHLAPAAAGFLLGGIYLLAMDNFSSSSGGLALPRAPRKIPGTGPLRLAACIVPAAAALLLAGRRGARWPRMVTVVLVASLALYAGELLLYPKPVPDRPHLFYALPLAAAMLIAPNVPEAIKRVKKGARS